MLEKAEKAGSRGSPGTPGEGTKLIGHHPAVAERQLQCGLGGEGVESPFALPPRREQVGTE
jgi:hypothetical protein